MYDLSLDAVLQHQKDLRQQVEKDKLARSVERKRRKQKSVNL